MIRTDGKSSHCDMLLGLESTLMEPKASEAGKWRVMTPIAPLARCHSRLGIPWRLDKGTLVRRIGRRSGESLLVLKGELMSKEYISS